MNRRLLYKLSFFFKHIQLSSITDLHLNDFANFDTLEVRRYTLPLVSVPALLIFFCLWASVKRSWTSLTLFYGNHLLTLLSSHVGLFMYQCSSTESNIRGVRQAGGRGDPLRRDWLCQARCCAEPGVPPGGGADLRVRWDHCSTG